MQKIHQSPWPPPENGRTYMANEAGAFLASCPSGTRTAYLERARALGYLGEKTDGQWRRIARDWKEGKKVYDDIGCPPITNWRTLDTMVVNTNAKGGPGLSTSAVDELVFAGCAQRMAEKGLAKVWTPSDQTVCRPFTPQTCAVLAH
jgi:hypothetical protein